MSAREVCQCGHSRELHNMRDLDGKVIEDGPCDKLDWGMSPNCGCRFFRAATNQRDAEHDG